VANSFPSWQRTTTVSLLVEATVPAKQFALPEVNLETEKVRFRVVRLVAYEPGRVMPFLWVDCDDPARLSAAVESDPSVSNVDVLSQADGACFLRVEWEPHVHAFLAVLRAADGVVLDLHGYDGAWYFRIFFPNDDFVTTSELCQEYGIDISIERADELRGAPEYGCFGLTEQQFDTVVRAYEHGYYDVPRDINQEELAEHFGISHQALSERLRRAHETIITNSLYRAIHRRDRSVLPPGRTEPKTEQTHPPLR